MEPNERLHAELARRQRDRLSAVDVELLRRRGELAEQGGGDLATGARHFDAKTCAWTHLRGRRSDDEHGEAVLSLGHEIEPELHARDRLVVLEVKVDVVDGTFGQAAPRTAHREQVGKGELAEALVLRRDANEVGA